MFSVVIPLFNKEKFIAACVQSALSQRFDDYEIIVVDDGSTDSGADVVAQFDPDRVRLIRQENAGVAAARNAGIDNAKFDWVAFLDADDVWAPWHLETLAEVVAEFPEAVGVGAVSVPVPVDFSFVESLESEFRAPKKATIVDYFKVAAKDVTSFHTSSAAVRRRTLERIGGFRDFKVGQDQECWVRVFLHGPCALIPRHTVFYRQNTGGAMDSLRSRPDSHHGDFAISNVSPAVATLEQLIRAGKIVRQRKSVCLYVDSRIAKLVLRLLKQGDLENARGFAHLIGRYRVNRFYIIKVASFFPRGTGLQSVEFLLSVVRQVKLWAKK